MTTSPAASPSRTEKGIQSLVHLGGAPMALERFFPLAIGMTKALEPFHRQSGGHQQLTPGCLFIQPKTGIVSITGSPSQQDHETTGPPSPPKAGQSLAYLSPEQTGRMNRAVDYRADFYSLGVIFYELLTGQLPFQAGDAMEWVHCHVARLPKPPSEVNQGLPKVISNLVMKLLAKTAEERYQTTTGLRVDLERCRTQWAADGRIEIFVLGQGDISDRLLLPQNLYGREPDIEILKKAFTRVATQDKPEMLLIAGYSGIGKTSLVRELHLPTAESQGIFISGKFDQYKRNIPYLTIAEAFREPIQQILTESETGITTWREQFQLVLGINAQLIIDIIPHLELIIGPQPALQELRPSEAQNRFHQVFRQFVGIFARPARPLVVFFDDLQWIDTASLELLTDLIIDPETGNLLLVGAYRDNEVSPTHPFMLALDEIRKNSTRLQTRTLNPLTQVDLGRLLADTFHTSATRLAPLTNLIFKKTAGNPFFVIQFLMTLQTEKLIEFHSGEGRWSWDINRIEEQGFTDNVVDLVLANLRKLGARTQKSLQLAACIGNRFDLTVLAIISASAPKTVQSHLTEALQKGLIRHLEDQSFSFIHDRVQQAAHLLIPEKNRAKVHLRIGRLLLEHSDDAAMEDRVFDIVHQFNLCRSLLIRRDEKYRVAELNLLAGRKARSSAAFNAALDYLRAGAQLLEEQAWEENYPLAIALFKELAEVEYLNSNYNQSKDLIDLLLSRARTDLEKAELYNILIVQYTLMANYAGAIQSGRAALRLMDIVVPEQDWKSELTRILAENSRILGDRKIASLIEDPQMTDPEKIVSLELLSNMVVPARYTDSTLFALVTVLNVNISLRFGLTAKSTVGYTAYGMVLNSEMGQYSEALEFGEMSLRLSERFNALTQKCQACFMVGHYLNHWVRHLKWADASLNEGIQSGLASGEMQWTGYIFAYKLFQPFYAGLPLKQIREELPKLLLFTQKTKNHWATDTLFGLQLALSALQGEESEPRSLTEEMFFANCEEHRSFGAKGRFAVLQAQILYLLGREEEALKAVLMAQELGGFFSSSISVAALNFYHSLILTALYQNASPENRTSYLDQVRKNQQQLQIWASHCPENFQHLHQLVDAELARITDQELVAEKCFENAIQSAAKQNFTQDLALANELAARFYQQRGFGSIAASFCREAYRGYSHWGANTKLKLLKQQFSQLKEDWQSNLPGEGLSVDQIDAIAVVKASQAISGNILLPDLLDTLMRIVIENAGADRGIFVLAQEECLSIAARASIKGGSISIQLGPAPLDSSELPVSMINYAQRTCESVILQDTQSRNLFSKDSYFTANRPLSVLCLPILRQSSLVGLLYLENNLARGVFTADRIAVLELLAAQAAISLENASLYLERSRTEAALRASEEKYRAIFENSGTALLFIEEDMTITICNKEFEKLYGAAKTEVEGRIKWPDLVAREEDLRRMKEYHQTRRIDPKEAPQTYEFQLVNRRGELRDIIVSVSVLPGTKQSLAALTDITERKRAVEALHESERKFRAIFDQTFQFIGLLTVDGILVEANRASMEFSGAKDTELIGKPFWETPFWQHSSKLQRQLKDAIGRAARGEFVRFEATHPAANGSLHYVDFSLKPVFSNVGEVIMLIPEGRDITERKQTEVALEEKAEQIQLLLNSTGEGIFRVALDGNCTFINPMALRTLGYNSDKFFLGKNMHELIHYSRNDGSPYPATECQMCRAYQTDDPVSVDDEVFWRQDGSSFPVDYTSHPVIRDGKTLGAVCTFRDITQRKETEEKVVRLAAIIEQAAEGIILTDLNWTIQYANPAFERITGYSREEIIGQRTTILKSTAHNREFYQNIRETMFHGEVWSGRLINKKKDGTFYEVDATGSPVRDEAGNIINFVGIQHDITNEIRLENQLRQSQKMEAIGTLAGGIAHDFNNILTAILGHSRLMSRKLAKDSPLHRHLENVLAAGNRAADLVKQILTVSRQSEQELKPVEVDLLIHEVAKLIRSTIPTTITIQQDISILPGQAVVLADETQLHQVLMNLCTNAAHAMRAHGGVLTLALSMLEAGLVLASQYPGLYPGSYVKLEVSDTGHGMNAVTMARIFDPYYTTKAVGEGTGLGLATVQSIIKSLGGQISVTSEPDQGSTFTIFLPLREGLAQTKKTQKEQLPRGTEHVLFVDDEQVLAELGQEILADLGYRVTVATDSSKALELFSERLGEFDLVITDMNMPGISGLDLAKNIISARAGTPIILYTGFCSEGLRKQAEAVGISKVVLKPYDVKSLAKTIHEVIKKT